MGLRAPAARALAVPDPESFLAWPPDATTAAFEPAGDPAGADVLLAPERIPEPLADAVRAAWELMPPRRRLERYPAPFGGRGPEQVLKADPAPDEEPTGQQDGHDEEGHDHGDMMAITGEPSADGLVMETMDVEAGPLGLALPGGLVVAATLDGDVVSACEVRRLLVQPSSELPPDPWGASAWVVAELAAREARDGVAASPAARWLRLAAVECERAVSHLAWLHGFARLLGWIDLATRARAALEPATAVRARLPIELATPDLPDVDASGISATLATVRSAGEELDRRLRASERLARRTAGVGRLTGAGARAYGLQGPAARAAGLAADVRAGDPGYRDLGFEPVGEDAGDARARALVRTAEVAQSCGLAAAAVERARSGGDRAPAFSDGPVGLAEGPRGPQRVLLGAAGPERTAPGARAAARAAGELAIGREWAAALAIVASFDLSAWRVGA